MNQLQRVTSWKRLNYKGEWKHNHIEYGHSKKNKPLLTCVNPDNHHWKKELGYLNERKQIIETN